MAQNVLNSIQSDYTPAAANLKYESAEFDQDITITEITSDSKGKKFNISAKDTTYEGGTGIQVNRISGDHYAIAAAIDGSSIIWDGTKLHANAVGQYGATPPIIADNTGSFGNIKLDYDTKTLVYDSTNKLRVKHDNQTIKYDASNGLHVPIDGDTLQYDAGSGKVKWPYTAGDGISLDGKKVKVKLDTTNGHNGEFGINSNGLYLNRGNSIIIKNGKLEATGIIQLEGSKAITATPVDPTTGKYNLGLVLGNSTLKIVNSATPEANIGLVGNYQGGTGITVSGNVINHTNAITGRNTALGDITNTKVTMPSITYDNQGHITAGNGVTFYAPPAAGANNQYLRSMSGAVGWVSFDSAPTSGSANGISSGAVYSALATKQNKLNTPADGHITIDGSNNIKSTITGGLATNVGTAGNVNVNVDNDTIKIIDNKLSAVAAKASLYTFKLTTGGWGTRKDLDNNDYFYQEVTRFDGGIPVNNVFSKGDRVPLLTLREINNNSANVLNLYNQWIKIYHADVVNDTSVSPAVKKLEFFAFAKPSAELSVNCTVLAVATGS